MAQPPKACVHTENLGAGKAIAVLTSGGDAQGKDGMGPPKNPPWLGCLGIKQAKMGQNGIKWGLHAPGSWGSLLVVSPRWFLGRSPWAGGGQEGLELGGDAVTTTKNGLR